MHDGPFKNGQAVIKTRLPVKLPGILIAGADLQAFFYRPAAIHPRDQAVPVIRDHYSGDMKSNPFSPPFFSGYGSCAVHAIPVCCRICGNILPEKALIAQPGNILSPFNDIHPLVMCPEPGFVW